MLGAFWIRHCALPGRKHLANGSRRLRHLSAHGVAMLIGFATTLQGSELVFQTLHEFRQGPSWPGKVAERSDGGFYGISANGGENGLGMVFRIATEGVLTPLASFNGSTGSSPNEFLVGHDGNVYGTALLGGAESGTGTIFKLTPDNTLIRFAIFNIAILPERCFKGVTASSTASPDLAGLGSRRPQTSFSK